MTIYRLFSLVVAFAAFAGYAVEPANGLIAATVACMRTAPSHSAELDSQALMGTPVRLKEYNDGWWLTETPEGYCGWVIDNAVAPRSEGAMEQWARSKRVIVSALDPTHVVSVAGESGPRFRVSDAVNGMILEVLDDYTLDDQWLRVLLPDGRHGFVARRDVTPLELWAEADLNVEALLDYAYAMEGTSYLWGGTSHKALDCSGLSKTAYYTQGIILPRNASQQARTGRRIEPADKDILQGGDLLFFGNPDTGKVTHVAIYINDGWYIHSSGRVKRNSLNPESPAYLSTPFLWAVRVAGQIGTPGITRASTHPWYFNTKL